MIIKSEAVVISNRLEEIIEFGKQRFSLAEEQPAVPRGGEDKQQVSELRATGVDHSHRPEEQGAPMPLIAGSLSLLMGSN